jgi:hypothetical protein
MKRIIIGLLMVVSVNALAQVKKKTIYKDVMTELYINQYDTIGGGTSYKMIGKDLRYEHVIDFDCYYSGSNIVGFIDKVLIFAKDADPKTSLIIEGVKVTTYPKYIQFQKVGVYGFRVLSKKKINKILDKCQSTTTL